MRLSAGNPLAQRLCRGYRGVSGDDLLDALCARSGIVCAVGAGGKKSTLYRLLRAHPGKVAFTATTATTYFPDDLPAEAVVAPPDALLGEVLRRARRVAVKLAYACPSDKPHRHAGVAPARVAECHRLGAFDLTLVKADGARMRLLKAPAPREPQLVPGTTTVLGLASARAIGLSLSAQHVHRPERVAEVVGIALGETLRPRDVARLIASPQGLLYGTEGLRVIPVINMADDAGRRAGAHEAARIALQLSDRYDRVVIASMTAAAPIVEVVTRG